VEKNYITPNGLKGLREELRWLYDEERPRVVKVVSWAASLGDRSENADYIYGKRRLREIDRRIRFLSQRLEAAEIVDPEKQSGSRVLFGATVRVENEEGKKFTYHIVGADETDAAKHKISWKSPMGKALLRSQVGDTVVVKKPDGPEEIIVESIKYQKID